MRRISLFLAMWLVGIGYADAAVRDAAAISRNSSQSQTTTARTSAIQAKQSVVGRTQSARTSADVSPRTNATVSRTSSNTVTRSAITPKRTSAPIVSTSRSATKTARTGTTTISRAATTSGTARNSRAATTTSTIASNTFGIGYNACRDAYFTCMDQFCAQQNESYRRCVCSSRLSDIQSRERQLSQTSDQIQDFKNLNIEVIPKTAAEVGAMLSASAGETVAATINDTSSSGSALKGISEVLASTKSKALSTAGTLDIAGDINAIWATTDLAAGASIANLTGEQLYNAVHSQCTDLVATSCPDQATFNMVVSAYGMYIENDCTTLLNALDKRKIAANSAIRETEREMNLARLENYNAHNSTSINDCIAQVRTDITAETACGKDYVHCLDISGKYLNRDTGAPIYTSDFYQLENQISLDGDILTNQSNRLIVAELNRKRIFATRGLETCRDLADDVWDEFMRQAITEIYQGQQEKIRLVKNECLDVVNECYDEQSQSLKDFSNIKEQLLLGQRLELSEQMCQTKLDACSNLYGKGTNGLQALLTAMHDITNQKIAQNCKTTLEEFAKDKCATTGQDTLHSYPYGCRAYAPGEQIYASNPLCNQMLWSTNNSSGTITIIDTRPTSGYVCSAVSRTYKSCKAGYYLAARNTNNEWQPDSKPTSGNTCLKCPAGSTCAGGIAGPMGGASNECGTDYAGSLYQQMVRYAMQVCVRPSEANLTDNVPQTVLQDINVVMTQIRIDMAKSLSAECDRLGGVWIDTPKTANTSYKEHKRFYDETSANTQWGFCTAPDDTSSSTNTGTDSPTTTTEDE